MFSLQPPRHISTLPLSTFASVHHFGRDERNKGHASDIVNQSKMTHSANQYRSAEARKNHSARSMKSAAGLA